MHVAIIFGQVGYYHLARLKSAQLICQKEGWAFTAIQVVNQTKDHPWGDPGEAGSIPLTTLLPISASFSSELHPDSPIAVSALLRHLNIIKPNVLAIPGWGFPVSRAALRWARHHKIPAILMSESKWDDEKRVWWKEQLKSWLYVKKFDAALVGGTLHKDYLIQLGFPGDRIFLGYDAVDNEYFEQAAITARQNPEAARQRQPCIPSKPYFLAATRFIPRKNVIRLIDAFADYHQQIGLDQAWDLVICGSGAEESAIYQRIQEHSLNSCIHLPGFITYQQIGDWYGLAQAFVHPALQEQWGLVVNEACAAGLPILCSKTVGASELVEEYQNGLLFDPEDAKDLTRTLLAVHHLEAEQRAQMGKISQKIVASYSPHYFGEGLSKAIYSTLNTSKNDTLYS